MNSPFGSSNQGGFRQQPQQQNFGQQNGFGAQTAGTFGGFQPQQQSFGFGGGQGFGGFQSQQSFGGFGGGQGFGGFNPFQGGFGGFQPQQQFNPFQGGYGGGFQPQSFGGGFNPMFGGIGGLGFNPMMGQGFGMPMQGFAPYQERASSRDPYQQQFPQPQQNSFATQDAELVSQMQNLPEYQALQNAQKAFEGSEGYKGFQQKRQDLVRQMQESQRQPMYGGIGGLGFNPMMGPQFGMPMTRDVAFSQGMLTPQQRQQMFDAQNQQRQTENAQREELKGKFGAGIFEGEGRGGGLRFREDYNESPELSAFTKTPEYQRALQNRQFDSSATNSVDMAFKDWLYKNKDTLSSGALGFMTDATKAKNAAQDAENARRFALTPDQRMAEDQEMHGRMVADIHNYLQNRGMQSPVPSQQPNFANAQNAQAALNASRLQYGY